MNNLGILRVLAGVCAISAVLTSGSEKLAVGQTVTGSPLPSTTRGAVPPALTPAVRMQFPPSPSNATSTNQTAEVQVYDLPVEMVGVVGARLRTLYGVNDSRVNVTTEPGTGRLMVMAPRAILNDVASRVELLQREIRLSGGPNANSQSNGPNKNISTLQRQYKLKNVTWRELEDALHHLSGPRMSVVTSNNGELAQFRLAGPQGMQDVLQIDRRSDVVTLQGSSTNVYAWIQVVGAVDQSGKDPDEGPRIISLAPANPQKVEKALNLVRTVAFQQAAEDEQVTGAAQVTPRGGANNGAAQAQANAKDGEAANDERAAAIGGVDSLDTQSGLFGDVQIEFVPELGLVIVRGGKRDVQRVLEVIDQIKKQSQETQPDIEVMLLKHIDSQAIETIAKELYEQVLAPRQGQISIKALIQPNALLLVGRKESIASVVELVNKLDQPLDSTSQLKVYKLLHTSSVDAEKLVKSFFDQSAPAAGGAAVASRGLASRVRIVADYRTNALVLLASPRDQLEVARLIAEIDVEDTPAQSEIRVFGLKYALAAELQPVLQSAVTGQAAPSTGQGNQNNGGQQTGTSTTGSSQASTPSSNLTIVSKDASRLDSGILAGVVVTSNPSINSLLVRAPSKSMELIAALIEQLDRPPSAEAQLKVFEIKNGDATALALLCQQLFGLPATAGTTTTGGLFGLNQNQGGAAGAAGSQGSLVQLRISVDTRTNSIIASGSAVDLEVVEVLLMRLDERGIETRTTEVIWLRNSNATAVAQSIQTLLTTQRTNIQQLLLTGQAISIFEQIDREVIVVAEPNTNSLIVSATPRYFERIREVIERLDRRPPMIMVQILLAEVLLEDNFELGTELGLQDALLFDRRTASAGTLGSPGFTVPGNAVTTSGQNVAGQGLSTFGMGRSNSTLGYGGLVLSAASQSVNILVRALQDANRLQILSRPQVMTLDTVAAFVQVGQQVPRITGVTGGSNIAGQQITTEDVSIGLIMRIQPRTNQDGLILLDVQVERSKLNDINSGIPVGFSANGDVIRSPIIDTTRAETRVSAYDGQTVVFAGLITKSRTSRSRRIPFLADIPIAGALFRFDSESESRSELLVVMTPRIVRDPQDMEVINQMESARMSWCLADVLNINGVSSLSEGNGLWGPACSPVIYPDLTPSVDYIDGIPVEGMPTDAVPSRSILLPDPSQFMIPQTEEAPLIQEFNQAPVQPSAPAAMDPLSYNNNQPSPSQNLGQTLGQNSGQNSAQNSGPVAYGNGAYGQSVFQTASQTTTLSNLSSPVSATVQQPRIMPLPTINVPQQASAVVPASAVMR